MRFEREREGEREGERGREGGGRGGGTEGGTEERRHGGTEVVLEPPVPRSDRVTSMRAQAALMSLWKHVTPAVAPAIVHLLPLLRHVCGERGRNRERKIGR